MEAKLNCEEVLAGLPLYVGGDLESPDPAAVDRHLAGCGDCRAAMERARGARAAFRGLSATIGAPGDIWSGVRAVLIEEGLLIGAPRTAANAPLSSARRSFGARWIPAAAVLLVGCGLWLVGDQFAASRDRAPEQRIVDESPERDPADRAPEPVLTPEFATPGVRPVALRPLSAEEWPAAQSDELQQRAIPDPGAGDGVMAGGFPPRYR